MVKLLLARREDVDMNTKDIFIGQTPLSWAVRKRHKGVVRLLTRDDIDVGLKDDWSNQTPVLWAMRMKYDEMIRVAAVRENIGVHSPVRNGRTLSPWTAGNGYDGVLRWVLAQKDVDVNSKDEKVIHRYRGGKEKARGSGSCC